MKIAQVRNRQEAVNILENNPELDAVVMEYSTTYWAYAFYRNYFCHIFFRREADAKVVHEKFGWHYPSFYIFIIDTKRLICDNNTFEGVAKCLENLA